MIGLGWEKRELWDFWNLDLITSETVGVIVIVGCVVGDMPRRVEDGTEGFGLETRDALDFGLHC